MDWYDNGRVETKQKQNLNVWTKILAFQEYKNFFVNFWDIQTRPTRSDNYIT